MKSFDWVRMTATILTVWLAFGMFSCGKEKDIPTGAVLSRILAYEAELPAGTIYSASAEEGATGYLSDSLCAALYGDGGIPAEWAVVEDFAIFLSAAEHPAELAVFRASSRADAEEIAELCARRLTILRGYYRGSDYEVYTSGGRVVILGRYVLMLVSSDSETALAEARAALR